MEKYIYKVIVKNLNDKIIVDYLFTNLYDAINCFVKLIVENKDNQQFMIETYKK